MYDKCPTHDIKIVLMDFNVKVGQEGIFGPTVGQFDNFAQRREADEFRRGANGDIHKATWLYLDRSTRNQIDYVVIDGRHVSNVLDVRTFRGSKMESRPLPCRSQGALSRAVP